MTTEAAEPASNAAGGPPTDVDLEQIFADLGRPIAHLLSSLSTAAVQLLRTLLDQAYLRGRHDAMADATASMPKGVSVVHNVGNVSEPVLTAQQIERMRRQSPGSGRF